MTAPSCPRLEQELGTTRATTDTLRAQTHEFANQLHTISGLLQLQEYDEVVRFVDGVSRSRTTLYDEVTSRVDGPHGRRAAHREGQPGHRARRGAAPAARRPGWAGWTTPSPGT